MPIERRPIGRMPLWQDDQAGPAHLKPFAIHCQVEPDGRPFRDMIKPIHDNAPQPGFRSDDRAVENNAFVQRHPVFNRNITYNYGPSNLSFDDASTLNRDSRIKMSQNKDRGRATRVVGINGTMRVTKVELR